MKHIKKILIRMNKLINNIKIENNKPYIYNQYFKNDIPISLMPGMNAYLSYSIYNNIIQIMCIHYKICSISISFNSNKDDTISIYSLNLDLNGNILNPFDDLPSNIFDWHEDEFFYWKMKYEKIT